MSYEANDAVRIEALRELASQISSKAATKGELTALSGTVEEIRAAGGEPNKIEEIKVNGTALTITDKSVDIAVPTDESVKAKVDAGVGELSAKITSELTPIKAKLSGISEGATKVTSSETNGHIKIDGADAEVYRLPEDVLRGKYATLDEVKSMLSEVLFPE